MYNVCMSNVNDDWSHPIDKMLGSRMRLDCDCGDPGHSLVFDYDAEDGTLEVYISVTPDEVSFWRRVGAAWRLLRGGNHILTGIMLFPQHIPDLVEYACSLVHDPSTR